jgi:hypothetical protein
MAGACKSGKETSMNMLASVVALAMVIAAVCGGYRYSLHLYASGALREQAHHMSSAKKSRLIRNSDEASLIQVRDYGLRYARTGILIVAIVLAALVLITMALITTVF